MNSENWSNHITPLAPYQNPGTYLLAIQLSTLLTLSFGRFQKAKFFTLPPSTYLYVGSALTQTNRPALLQRVARHASRSASHFPHPIRQSLLAYAHQQGLQPAQILPKSTKKMHWHIDYLLESPQTNLIHIFLIPSPIAYESSIAQALTSHPHINLPIPGLGASDKHKETHFLQLAPQFNLAQLPAFLRSIIGNSAK